MGLVKIGEVCNFQGGTQPPKNEWKNEMEPNYVRMLQIRDFTQGKEKHIEFVKDSKKLNKCKADDILIGRYGASVGKILTGLEGAYNVAIIKTVPDETRIHKRYLYYFLLNPRFQNFISNIGGRAAQQGFNKEDISDYKLFLPSLSDQLHIANLLSKAESLITQRKQSIALLDEYLKSTFLEMFGDPVGNEKGWKTIPFSESGQFHSGGTPSKAKREFWEGTFPWVSPKDMKVSTIKDSQDHISDVVFKETSLKRIAPNHLLIVVRGMILAHSFPLAINSVDIAINQDMKAINPIKGLNIIYLQHCLNALKRQILGLITSAGHGTKRFDSSAMQMLNIPIPPPFLQTQFAQIVEKVDALKMQYQNSLRELENLYGSLSQRAFRGELTLKPAAEQVLIAAEPEPNYGKVIEFTSRKCNSTERAILAGHIINKTNKEDFGRVKFQKLLHLTEYHCKIDIDSNFTKKVAGPHDGDLLKDIESTLKRYHFYDINQSPKGNHKVNYTPLSSVSELEEIFDSNFESERERIDSFLTKFRKSSWEQCEIISTLYAVWNNRLILNQEITDELLKQDFQDWDTQKVKYIGRLDDALQWMKTKGVIPIGWGKLIE